MYFTIFCQGINVFALFDQKVVRRQYTSAEVVKLFEQYDNEVFKLLINTYYEVHKLHFVEFLVKCIQAGSVNMSRSISYTQSMSSRLPCLLNVSVDYVLGSISLSLRVSKFSIYTCNYSIKQRNV